MFGPTDIPNFEDHKASGICNGNGPRPQTKDGSMDGNLIQIVEIEHSQASHRHGMRVLNSATARKPNKHFALRENCASTWMKSFSSAVATLCSQRNTQAEHTLLVLECTARKKESSDGRTTKHIDPTSHLVLPFLFETLNSTKRMRRSNIADANSLTKLAGTGSTTTRTQGIRANFAQKQWTKENGHCVVRIATYDLAMLELKEIIGQRTTSLYMDLTGIARHAANICKKLQKSTTR